METPKAEETPLNRALRQSGHTAMHVADACGVSRATVFNWKAGASIPDRHRPAMEKALGAERARLLFERQTPALGGARAPETPAREAAVLRSAARVLTNRGKRELAASVAAEAGAM
jgi:hypothetical protein